MSNETKWTKGPWSAIADGKSMIVDAADGQAVVGGCGCCGSPFGVDDKTECKANAHLIAAAPDLYEALEDAKGVIQALIDEGYTGYADQRGRIDRALAKARGEQ